LILKDAISTVEIFKNAKSTTIAIFTSCGTIKKVFKGEHLFLDKEDVKTLYFVVSGMAALYKCNSFGEKKVIFVYGKGQALNEVILNDLPASINCEILQDSIVLCIPKNQFLQAMEQDFELTKAVINSMSIKIRRLYRQMKNTTNSLRGDKKIAAKLWKLSMDYGIPCDGGVQIECDLTITYLADMLGSKRETVSRQLKILTDLGLVIYKSNRFIIPNRDELNKYFKSS
jgi:CRP-like cAMP-binding protein